MRILFILGIFAILLISGCNTNKNKENLKSENSIIVTDGFKHTVPLENVINVLPRDAIPSIDKPKFVSVQEAEKFLDDNEVVFGVEFNKDARAYPQQILNWHEIVNDKIGNVPVAVTFCPLCGSGIVFKRVVNGQETTFGVSGKLYNSDLVMYDRLTNTLWSQLDGTAIIGELAEQKLEILPLTITSWQDWKKSFPNSKVLSRDTGFVRDYDTYPYGTYESSAEILFPISTRDSTYHPKTRIYGIEVNNKFKAYLKGDIAREKIINDNFNGKNLLIVYDESIDDARIFYRDDKEFILKNGKLVSGDIEYDLNDNSSNNKLQELQVVKAFWFAWYAFHSDTEIYKT